MAAKRTGVDAGDLGIVDPETATRTDDDGNTITGNGNDNGVDNGNVGESGSDGAKRNKDGSLRKKRGRKAGQTATRKSDLSVNGVEKILLSLHSMAAVSMKAPELMLDEAEAKAMSEGILAVQSHYNFAASAEVMAWCNLAFILLGVYGPRVALIRMRKKEERPKEKKMTSNVADLYGTTGLTDVHHAPAE